MTGEFLGSGPNALSTAYADGRYRSFDWTLAMTLSFKVHTSGEQLKVVAHVLPNMVLLTASP
jgi:hypothetical protein